MTQEVDAQTEWTTEADVTEDTDAQAALSDDVEVQADPDPSALISSLQSQLDQLKKDFSDSKHVTNRATSSLDRLTNRLDEFATKSDLENTQESIAGIRSLMDVGLSDVMSDEGKNALAEQGQEDTYSRALNSAKNELREELSSASPDSVAGQVTDDQLNDAERRASEASSRVYGYAEAKGISADDVAKMPIWDQQGRTLEEAITNAKEYIDTMSEGSDSRLAQRKEAAAGSPERATTSSSVLTIDKMKNMSPQELMKIPKEIRQKALRGG